MIKTLWAKWRAWATIDDTIEALITKHFAAAVAFEQHAEAKAEEVITHSAVYTKALELAEQAEAERVKAIAIAAKVRAIFA